MASSQATRWSSAAWLSTLLSIAIVAIFSGVFFVRYQEARKAAVERSVRLLATGTEALRQAANRSTDLVLGQVGCENGIAITIPPPDSLYPPPKPTSICVSFEQVLGYIPKGHELFDKAMIVDGTGAVLDQTSSASAPNLLSTDSLMLVNADGKVTARQAKLREVGAAALVESGGDRFELFAQPLSRQVKATNGNLSQLYLCGLVSDARLLRECLAVSPLYVVALSALLALVLLLPPFIRTALLSYSQRLRFFDAVTVGMCLFFFLMLVTLLGEGVYSYSTLAQLEENRLEALAGKVFDHLATDVGKHKETLKNLSSAVLAGIPPEPDRTGPKVAVVPEPLAVPTGMDVEAVAWAGVDGLQRVKWSAATDGHESSDLTSTPQLADVGSRPYFKQALRAGADEPIIVDSIKTFTTGQTRAVFATRADQPGGARGVLTLTAALPTFEGALLPEGMGFAIVNRDGWVAFHSEEALSNSHNLLDESDGNEDLRRLLIGNRVAEDRVIANLNYWGIDHLAFVRRLNDRWAVVTFEESEPLRARVFKCMVRALLHCSIYTLVFSVVVASALLLTRRRVPWPDLRRWPVYAVMAITSVILGPIAAWWVPDRFNDALLCIPLLLAGVGLLARYFFLNFYAGATPRSPQERARGYAWQLVLFPLASSLAWILCTAIPAHALVRGAVTAGENGHGHDEFSRWLASSLDLHDLKGKAYDTVHNDYMNAWLHAKHDWSVSAAFHHPSALTSVGAFVICLVLIAAIVSWGLRTLYLWGVEALPASTWPDERLEHRKLWCVVPSRRSFDRAPSELGWKVYVATPAQLLTAWSPPSHRAPPVVASPLDLQQMVSTLPAELGPEERENWRLALGQFALRYVRDQAAPRSAASAEAVRLLTLEGEKFGCFHGTKQERLTEEIGCSVETLAASQRNLLDGALAEVDSRERGRRLRDACRDYYQELWDACLPMERLTLVQLAEEGFVNPRRVDVVRQLMARGLLCRRPMLTLMNDSFALFARAAGAREQISRLESPDEGFSWDHLKAPLITLFVCSAGAFFYTQRALFDSTLVFATTLSGVLPHLGGWLAALGLGPAERLATAASKVANV